VRVDEGPHDLKRSSSSVITLSRYHQKYRSYLA
jgi:hypothetical protein